MMFRENFEKLRRLIRSPGPGGSGDQNSSRGSALVSNQARYRGLRVEKRPNPRVLLGLLITNPNNPSKKSHTRRCRGVRVGPKSRKC